MGLHTMYTANTIIIIEEYSGQVYNIIIGTVHNWAQCNLSRYTKISAYVRQPPCPWLLHVHVQPLSSNSKFVHVIIIHKSLN